MERPCHLCNDQPNETKAALIQLPSLCNLDLKVTCSTIQHEQIGSIFD